MRSSLKQEAPYFSEETFFSRKYQTILKLETFSLKKDNHFLKKHRPFYKKKQSFLRMEDSFFNSR